MMGTIRIGTLHDFRKSEHKKGIADPAEGTKQVLHHVGEVSAANVDEALQNHGYDIKALETFGVMKIGKESQMTNFTFRNISMSKTFNEPDCFIICSSIYKSKRTMSQFEGADSCIEINQINTFYNILTNTLNTISPVVFRGVHKVIYKDRQEKWNGHDWGHHPALIKEKEFEPQGEIRAIWQPKFNQSIEPMILCNYRLGSCVSYVTI